MQISRSPTKQFKHKDFTLQGNDQRQTTQLTKPSLKEKLVIVEFLTPLYEVSKTHAEENR